MGADRIVLRGAAVLAGCDPRSLVAADRRRELVEARAAAAIALRRLGFSLEAAGAAIGGRRRHTVHHAVRMAARPSVAAMAAALELLATTVGVE